MKDLGKIVAYNILFIFTYDIILRLITNSGNVMILSMILVILQVMVDFILSIVYYSSNQTRKGHSYLLTPFLVLLIGFGVCMTNLH